MCIHKVRQLKNDSQRQEFDKSLEVSLAFSEANNVGK